MPEATKQKRSACSSCPFRSDVTNTCFPPEKLEETVLDYLDNGRIHPCHSNTDYMCSGYLRFADKYFESNGGMFALQMVRISDRLGLFDETKVPTNINVFSDVSEMLDSHQERMDSNPFNFLKEDEDD